MKTERQIDRDNRYGKPHEWALAITAGLASGYTTFKNLVTDHFKEDLEKYTNVVEEFQKNHSTLDGIVNERLKTALASGSKEFDEATERYIQQTHNGKRAFSRFANEFAEKRLGLASGPISSRTTGLIQRFRTFSPSTQFGVGFKSVVAVGAGVGVTLMAFNQLNTRDKLNEIQKTNIDNGSRLDALLGERKHSVPLLNSTERNQGR